MCTPLAYIASVLNGPWTSHRPFVGNSAVPQISTGPVYSVSMPQCARVDVVRAPAGDHAGAELLAAQPAGTVVAVLRVDAVLGVEDVRRRARATCRS